jgi:hypothetical protein
VPYRVQKPYIIVNGQRLTSPNAVPQRLPFCDKCDAYASTIASVFTELPQDKLWNWFSYPKFSCQDEALMGCEKHPVEAEIRFLDGQVERFIRLPLTRWQRVTEKDTLIIAIVLAVVFAVIVGVLLKWGFGL